MSTSEERLDVLRLAATGSMNLQTGQRLSSVNIVADAQTYLNFISPATPDESSLSNQTYDVIYKDGWNAAISALLDEADRFPATATVLTGTVRNYANSLRK